MKNEEIKKYIETLYNLFYASNRFYYKFAKQYGISDYCFIYFEYNL